VLSLPLVLSLVLSLSKGDRSEVLAKGGPNRGHAETSKPIAPATQPLTLIPSEPDPGCPQCGQRSQVSDLLTA